MRRLITLVLVAGLAWYAWDLRQENAELRSFLEVPSQDAQAPLIQPVSDRVRQEAPAFSCDGRTHCSQMRSCAEATYFIRNCPNTEMDGDNDGRPCETQWCN